MHFLTFFEIVRVKRRTLLRFFIGNDPIIYRYHCALMSTPRFLDWGEGTFELTANWTMLNITLPTLQYIFYFIQVSLQEYKKKVGRP
jgi:hypothetical protein